MHSRLNSYPIDSYEPGDRKATTWLALLGALLAGTIFYTPLLLALLIVVPALAYFLTRPYELLLVMTFLIPFNFIVPVGDVPVAAELLKVFLWIPFLISFRQSGRKFITSSFNKYLIVIASLIALSLVRTHDLPYTVKESVRMGSNIGLALLVPNLVRTREQVSQVLRVLMVSVACVVIYGLYQFAIQDFGLLFWIVNPRMDTSLAHGRTAFWEWRNRMISVLTSEMEIAHYSNLCIPVGVALWMTEGGKSVKSKWLWITVLTLIGLGLSFTFGAWLTLFLTIGLFAWMFEPKFRWKVMRAALGILIVGGIALTFGPFGEFMREKITGTGTNSLLWDAYTRFDLWYFALQTWWSHPFIGVGIGNFEYLFSFHQQVVADWAPAGGSPHQTYLYLLVMFGLIGTFAMLKVFLGNIKRNLALRKDPIYGVFALAFAFALCTTLIGGFSDNSGSFGPHAGYLVWLLIGLGETVRRLASAESVALSTGTGTANIQ